MKKWERITVQTRQTTSHGPEFVNMWRKLKSRYEEKNRFKKQNLELSNQMDRLSQYLFLVKKAWNEYEK
jgi:hypothetical protein